MPRSACVVGLAKTGVIPRKQFYSKLFLFNTVILVRWFEEVWNQGREQTVDELMAPNAV